MIKVRQDALPQKVKNISENMWAQAVTVHRISHNMGRRTRKRYRGPEHRLCDFGLNYIRLKISKLGSKDIYVYATMLMETDYMPKNICI